MFLKQISAILRSSLYRYNETFVKSTAKNQAKKEPPLLRLGKSEFRTRAGS